VTFKEIASANDPINFQKFYDENRLRSFARQSIETCELGPFEKKEIPRFFYLENAKKLLEAKRAKGERQLKSLEVAEKIILIFVRIISVLMPLASCYCPAWVPWGIGLPLVIIFSIVHGKIQGKIDTKRREVAVVPYLKEFLKHRSAQKLHPIGEWDLPEIDERLKSDLMMKNELQKRHPKSAKEIESILGKYDLELTPAVQQYAAYQFAGIRHREAKWAALKKAQCGTLEPLRRKDWDAYANKQKKVLQAAYEKSNSIPFDTFDVPALSARDQIEALLVLYSNLNRLYSEVKGLVEEGEKLYALYPCIEDNLRTFAQWPAHKKDFDEAKEKIAPFISLLDKGRKPPVSSTELFKALSDIQSSQLRPLLLLLIHQTREIKTHVQRWIGEHPEKRLEAVEERMRQWDEKDILTRKDLKSLSKWIGKYPRWSKKKCVEIPRKVGFPRKIKGWLETRPDMRFKSVNDLFMDASTMRKRFDLADKKLKTTFNSFKISTDQNNLSNHPGALVPKLSINSSEDYLRFNKALTEFKKEALSSISKLILQAGTESRIKIWLKAMFFKTPALPFAQEKLPPRNTPLRMRKIEEFHLNALLRSQDSKMLWTNRGRKIAVQIPINLLLVVEAIFAIYFSTHWLFWGCCILGALLSGVSYYVDYRLKKMDREKQTIKLQSILRDHPDISVIPGTRPRLAELKAMQEKYGLEGVRLAWARTLMKGDSALRVPKDIKSARNILSDLASEGRKKSTHYLENRLILLRTAFRGMDEKSSHKKPTKKRILEIEKTFLYAKYLKMDPTSNRGKETRKQLLRYEKNILEIQYGNPDPKSEKAKKITEHLKRMEVALARKSHTERKATSSGKATLLPSKIKELEFQNSLLEDVWAFLVQAATDEGQERNSTEKVEDVLKELKKILRESRATGANNNNNIAQRAKDILNRLKSLPQKQIVEQSKKVEQDLFLNKKKLTHILYEPLTIDRHDVDKKWDHIGEKIVALKRRRADYEKVAHKFNVLPQKLETIKSQGILLQGQLALLQKATEGDQARNFDESVQDILAETKEILQKSQSSEQQIESLLDRLKLLPKPKLLAQIKQLESLNVQDALQQDLLHLVRQSLEGKHVRGSDEKLENILEEMKEVLQEFQSNSQPLVGIQERLQLVPQEQLLNQIEKIKYDISVSEHEFMRLGRALLRLQQDKNLGSGDAVKKMINTIDAKLAELEKTRHSLQEQYDSLFHKD